MPVHVNEVYEAINRFAPFSTQEKWDNSGFLAGDFQKEVTGVLISLDISAHAVKKAAETGCNLIISHHPVIFSPIKTLYADSIVYQLARQDIAAICCHTPLDMAQGGINDLLADRLCSVWNCEAGIQPLMPDGLGRILTLNYPEKLAVIAEQAKKALHCEVVRISRYAEKPVQKIGICSGSGASLLEEIAGKCDCLLTGDVKHDRWYKAEELHLPLIDCGHYHTEVIMISDIAQKLKQAFPGLNIIEFAEGNPVQYI